MSDFVIADRRYCRVLKPLCSLLIRKYRGRTYTRALSRPCKGNTAALKILMYISTSKLDSEVEFGGGKRFIANPHTQGIANAVT